jgi:DNA polymerase-3 subunit delta
MEMLALHAGTRGDSILTSADAALLDHVPDFNIFTLIKQLQSGYAAAVWKHAAAESPDDLLFPLLGLLQRESRILWQVLAGENASVNPRDINERRDLARKIGISGLSRLWDAMHEAELSVKSGRNSPEQALSTLLATVTLLFAPHSR